MTDNMMPELTLTPDDTATAAAVEVPSLTLTPEAPEVPKEEEKKIEPVEMDDKLLTEEEKQAVEAFSHKTLPIWAVQWHPERMTGRERLTREGPDMEPLFQLFCDRCREN